MTIQAKSLFKAIFLIILVLVIFTKATSADLFVTKIASNNTLTTTTLDFSHRDTATNSQNSILFNVSGFIAGGFKVEGVRVKKDGRENFTYRMTTVKTAGDDAFCQALQLTVLQDWQIKYQGNLLDFSFNSTIKTNGLDDWIFYINLPQNELNLTNKVCDFNFNFKTVKTNPESQGGFWDEEILTNHIASGLWTP